MDILIINYNYNYYYLQAKYYELGITMVLWYYIVSINYEKKKVFCGSLTLISEVISRVYCIQCPDVSKPFYFT